MSSKFSVKYNKYLDYFNEYLDATLSKLSDQAPKTVKDAMRYAVSGGGKRIRPILCMATSEILGVDFREAKELALAIELIHSYSLVHDDLPAMDNDDYRRGKLSTHKKFGEANGILAGDALLNFAFEVCLSKQNTDNNYVKACRIVAEFAGYSGMIAGQVLDLENEKNDSADLKILYDIISNKTAKLITAPMLAASLLCGGKFYNELSEFGYNLGCLFQITDDIMDEEGTLESIGKTPHKDKEVGKLTSVKIFGLNGAKERAKYHYEQCRVALSKIDNNEFLSEFTDLMYERKK